jgi:cytochrome P450
MSAQNDLPVASLKDSVATLARVVTPTLAKGVLIRRPRVVGMAETLGLDDRAVRQMQKLRERYGSGPLMIRVPGPPRAVILSPEDARHVLDNSPEPFATASSEKRAALSHFEPKNALISHGAPRAKRRAFNERVLQTDKREHDHGPHFARVVDSELRPLVREAGDAELDWSAFNEAWHRMVRRLILGDGARDDDKLTDMLGELRARGNWAFLRRKDEELRDRIHARLNEHLQRAEPGSLAERIAATPSDAETAPSHQVAQWFFAFDPGGMATFRALALLSTHPEIAEQAAPEIASEDPGGKRLLRAALLESLRLWPTTPAILRETTRSVDWPNGRMRKGTGLLIFAPYFHRDETRLPFAHRFQPDVWDDPDAAARSPLVPFSQGPGKCPANNLVPFVASMALSTLLRDRKLRLIGKERLSPTDRLPVSLDNYSLRFSVGA